MKPRFWTRRRLVMWALIAALAFACGSILHDRRQTQRTIGLIERIDRLGGHVSTYREYANWQRPFARWFDWNDEIIGQDAYNVVLPKTSLSADALREVVTLPHLRTLDLSDATGVDDAALAVAARAEGLIVLKLAGTAVTDAGIAALPALPDLMNVDLDDTRITDVAVDALLRRPGVTLVHAGGTGATAVTGEGITVGGPLRAGGTVTIAGTVVVRDPPTLATLRVYAQLCEPGKRNGYFFGPGAGVALKPVAGRQTFALTGPVGPRRPGRYALQVNVGSATMPNVTYRLLRQDVDVLPAAGE